MAELLLYIDAENKMFDFNVAHQRDGGVANFGWESSGWFPTIHDALEQGRAWWADAKKSGYKRGSKTVPRVWPMAA